MAGVTSQLVPGAMFEERYLVESTLGRGGYSQVYLATDTTIERTVAIKVLEPLGSDERNQETAKQRFFREARFLGKLRDPHIVRLHDYGEHDGHLLFMVLEHVDGVSLRHEIDVAAPLDHDRALRITEQILRALCEVHSLGILHRDLKPTNIMLYRHVEDPDHVKLLDFGIAKSLYGTDATITDGQRVIGTPAYLSPEQIFGEPLGPPSDLFAVGLVLYEMLAGRKANENGVAGIEIDLEELPERLAAMAVSTELARLVLKFTAPTAAGRFGTAEEALEAVRQVRASFASGERTRTGNRAVASRRRPLPWGVPIALGAIAVVALGLLWRSVNEPSAPESDPPVERAAPAPAATAEPLPEPVPVPTQAELPPRPDPTAQAALVGATSFVYAALGTAERDADGAAELARAETEQEQRQKQRARSRRPRPAAKTAPPRVREKEPAATPDFTIEPVE